MSEINQLLFSCEYFTPRSIVQSNALPVIADTEIYFSLRVDPGDLMDDAFLEMMRTFRDYGVEDHFIPWPMVELEDGYYPNTRTVDKFAPIMRANCEWYSAHDFPIPMGMLFDLEPPMDAEGIKSFKYRMDHPYPNPAPPASPRPKSNWLKTVGTIVDTIDENIDLNQFQRDAEKFSEIQAMMHEYGTKAIAVAIPYTYDDLSDGQLFIQNYLMTPITNVEWDMVNFMTFQTGYVEDTKHMINEEEYQHILYSYCKDFVQHWGPERASATLGVTSYETGVRRQWHIDPEIYRCEASACLAAGMKDVGIFALEGVLLSENPREWIDTVMQARAVDFNVDSDKLELAGHVRQIFQAVDFISPTLSYLVKSNKILDIFRALAIKK